VALVERVTVSAVKVMLAKPKPRPKKEDKKADSSKGKKGGQEGAKDEGGDGSKVSFGAWLITGS
jgi:hypothetical protein